MHTTEGKPGRPASSVTVRHLYATLLILSLFTTISILGPVASAAAPTTKPKTVSATKKKTSADPKAANKEEAEQEAPIDLAHDTRDYVTLKNSPRIEVGKACVERLGTIFTDGAGMFVTARAGDWRLSNESVSVTFASPDTISRRLSQPLTGYHQLERPEGRIPGALIDVAVDGTSLDFMDNFTQGIGPEDTGPVIEYDSAKPVKQGREVGLRLEGSPFESSTMRVQTTYWLAGGSHHLRIETSVLGVPEGEPAPVVYDVGGWGAGGLLVENYGLAHTGHIEQMNADFYLCQGADICAGVVPLQGFKAVGSFINSPARTRITYRPARSDAKATSGTQATPAAAQLSLVPTEDQESTETMKTLVREFWLGRGNYGSVTQQMLVERKLAVGAITGKTSQGTSNKPEGEVNVRLLKIDMQHVEEGPKLFTIVTSDKLGHYTATLPVGHYFIKPEAKSSTQGTRILLNADVKAGKTEMRNLQVFPESGVRVRVLDAQTSRPLAARLRFEAVAPTPQLDFGFPLTAEGGYSQYTYIPAEGRVVYVPKGHWVIYASHGINYEIKDEEIHVENGQVINCTIRLKETNPAPGWVGVSIGAHTTATPGCSIIAKDLVLMAAAEGLDWVVSGDYETITDFGPIISKLGLSKALGSSRGFRTILPRHPEWGQFLVYPVAADAPDPSDARREWAAMDSAHDFVSTLRRLYPGALIQSELPYTIEGLGYFGVKYRNVYEISFDPNPKLDLSIDAINLFPSRQQWDPTDQLNFLGDHLARGRSYLGSTSENGRLVFGGEPGYPRLQAWVGKSGAGELSEKKLFEAIRAHRTQVTTGPHIEFKVGDAIVGGMTGIKKDEKISLRITAPGWAVLNNYVIAKEGRMQMRNSLDANSTDPQRLPDPESDQQYKTFTLQEMQMNRTKDTLLGVATFGAQSLSPALPLANPLETMFPFSVASPIILDANGNGHYDPIKIFRDLGK